MITSLTGRKKRKNLFFNWPRAGCVWKNCDKQKWAEQGYFLMEIMVALSIFTLILTAVVPAWLQLQYNLDAAHQKSVALYLAQNELVQFRYHLPLEQSSQLEMNGYSYLIMWEVNEAGRLQEGRLTVTWISSTRAGEELLFVVYRKKEAIL